MIDRLSCIKDLYKSTYQGLAFKQGSTYELIKEDEYIFVKDETGHSFSFVREPNGTMYVLGDYFVPLANTTSGD